MEPLDRGAQNRVVTQILAYELVAIVLFLGALFAPPITLIELGEPATEVRLGLLLSALAIGSGLAAAALQAHYVMRFMWARGQFLDVLQNHFDEHAGYFLVGWVAPIVALLLTGLVWVLNSAA